MLSQFIVKYCDPTLIDTRDIECEANKMVFSFATVPAFHHLKFLLEDEYVGGKIERFEIPGIRAVHFLLRDHLDRGFNSTSTYDTLGKNVCEYLRCKWVDLPNKFLHRGRI